MTLRRQSGGLNSHIAVAAPGVSKKYILIFNPFADRKALCYFFHEYIVRKSVSIIKWFVLY